MKDLNNRVVVITGAASGIGACLAEQAAAQGARLALCDISEDGLETTRAACGSADVLTQRVDVADRDAMQAFRDHVIERFGQVDLVINNAGVAHMQMLVDASYEDFEWIMGINFWGVVYGSKAFLPDLAKRPDAALVNLSSVFGLVAVPSQGTYNASKFAVRGFTEALRIEMGETNVHVMCVHPGGIKTAIAHSARFYTDHRGNHNQAKLADNFKNKMARTTPETAARTIYADLAKKKGRCLIGTDAKLISLIARLMPVNYWRVLGRLT